MPLPSRQRPSSRMSLTKDVRDSVRLRRPLSPKSYADEMTVHRAIRDMSKEKDPIKLLKLASICKGPSGLLNLGSTFRRMDNWRHRNVDLKEFTELMQDFSINNSQIKDVFDACEKEKSGQVNVRIFLKKARSLFGGNHLLKNVDDVFYRMDKGASGEVTHKEIGRRLHLEANSMYKSGETDRDTLVTKFLECFKLYGATEDKVTLEEFQDYCLGLYEFSESDAAFIVEMHRMFK